MIDWAKSRTLKTDCEVASGSEIVKRHESVARLVKLLRELKIRPEETKKLARNPNDMTLFWSLADLAEREVEAQTRSAARAAGASFCPHHPRELRPPTGAGCWRCPSDKWPPGHGVDLRHLRRT